MNQKQIATQQVRISDSARIMQEQNSSVLTISEYCTLTDISETTYYYWLRRLRKTDLTSTGIELVDIPDPEFPALLGLGQQQAAFTPKATISVGDFSIGVSGNTLRDFIQTLMVVAAHVE